MRSFVDTQKDINAIRSERDRLFPMWQQCKSYCSRIVPLVLIVCAVATVSSEVSADITYSGNAVFRIESTSSDPLELRPSDWNGTSTLSLPMTFSITISDDPSELLTNQIRPNVSSFVKGSITVSGKVIEIVEMTQMIFGDNVGIPSDQIDLAKFEFNYQGNGLTFRGEIRFDLPTTTFSLNGPTATPPTFGLNRAVKWQYGPRSYGYQIRVRHFIEAVESTNQQPVAEAGPNQTIDCMGESTMVQLDATGSSDPDGDELSYEWSVPAGVVLDDPTSPTPTGTFPIGITAATLTVTDGNGGLDVDDVVITVVDQTPPEVSCTTSMAAIWPPKHDMVPVMIYVDATDHCTNPEDLILGWVTIESNEPDDAEGLGDGETTGDVDGQDGFSAPVDVTDLLTYNPETASFEGLVFLRAERDGEGVGRSYSINATVLDSSNNIADTSCVVVVPHDRRKQK